MSYPQVVIGKLLWDCSAQTWQASQADGWKVARHGPWCSEGWSYGSWYASKTFGNIWKPHQKLDLVWVSFIDSFSSFLPIWRSKPVLTETAKRHSNKSKQQVSMPLRLAQKKLKRPTFSLRIGQRLLPSWLWWKKRPVIRHSLDWKRSSSLSWTSGHRKGSSCFIGRTSRSSDHIETQCWWFQPQSKARNNERFPSKVTGTGSQHGVKSPQMRSDLRLQSAEESLHRERAELEVFVKSLRHKCFFFLFVKNSVIFHLQERFVYKTEFVLPDGFSALTIFLSRKWRSRKQTSKLSSLSPVLLTSRSSAVSWMRSDKLRCSIFRKGMRTTWPKKKSNRSSNFRTEGELKGMIWFFLFFWRVYQDSLCKIADVFSDLCQTMNRSHFNFHLGSGVVRKSKMCIGRKFRTSGPNSNTWNTKRYEVPVHWDGKRQINGWNKSGFFFKAKNERDES